MENDALIRIHGLSKAFRPARGLRQTLFKPFSKTSAVIALQDISLNIERGRIVGLLGPNGAGKTTLLKICATLVLPDTGRAVINGRAVGQDDDAIKRQIGLVTSQERSFYWRLSGRENLLFFAALNDLTGTRARQRIDELLSLFDIDYADRRFYEYSAGMKQKFALMRGLIADPTLLLFDEPFQSLDFATATELKTFSRDILVKKQGKTLLYATHLVTEAASLCERFVILNKGKLQASGTLDDVRAAARAPKATLADAYLKLTTPEGA